MSMTAFGGFMDRIAQLAPRLALTPVSDVEQRLARLERIIKIEDDGSVTIECNKITIKAASTVEIECATNLRVRSSMNLRLDAGANLSVNGCSNVEVQAGAGLSLKGAAATSVRGSTITLNGGSKPLARSGDVVANGVIQSGSPTITA
jgi:hypothetical protein